MEQRLRPSLATSDTPTNADAYGGVTKQQKLSELRLPMFKSFVARPLRFWIIVLFAIFYQFSGGIYLAALSQMVGELAFLSEEVTMASYCSLIGLNMIFPILFRWKFFFFTRQMWFVSSIAEIICAIGAAYSTLPWLLWAFCLFAYYSIVRLKWTLRSYFFLAFSLIAFYEVSLYFLIDPSTEAGMLDLPMFAFGMAEIMIESGVTYALSQYIPFPHFFMNITIVGFVRCGVGTTAGAALLERLFSWSEEKHWILNGADMGNADYGYAAVQNLMSALKECYGWLALGAVVFLVVVLGFRFRHTARQLLPTMAGAVKYIWSRGFHALKKP